MADEVELKYTKTDTSSWGFIEIPTANSNGCKCCKACRDGTGANPCAGCTYQAHRKDDKMGCDEKRCKCAVAVAYVSANPNEFA